MSFIRYLGSIGQVVGIQVISEAVPDLMALDAEACYMGWQESLILLAMLVEAEIKE